MIEPALEPELSRSQFEEIKSRLDFGGENYADGHQEIFSELPEHVAFKQLYLLLHELVRSPTELSAGKSRCEWRLGLYLSRQDLYSKYFLKHLGKERGEEFVQYFTNVYKEAEDVVNRARGSTNIS